MSPVSIYDIHASHELDHLLYDVIQQISSYKASSRNVPLSFLKYFQKNLELCHLASQILMIFMKECTIGEYIYNIHHSIRGKFKVTRKISLFLTLEILPRLKAWLDNKAEDHRHDSNPSFKSSSWVYFLVIIYPPLKWLLFSLNTAFLLPYLVGVSRFPNFFSFLFQTPYKYFKAIHPVGEVSHRRSQLFRIAHRAFMLSMFSLQFLQWWRSRDASESHNTNNELTKIIPPSKLPTMQEIFRNVQPGLCYVCGFAYVNPVYLTVSGVVGCHKCISKYVTEHQCCPLTHYDCATNQLCRIFDSNHEV